MELQVSTDITSQTTDFREKFGRLDDCATLTIDELSRCRILTALLVSGKDGGTPLFSAVRAAAGILITRRCRSIHCHRRENNVPCRSVVSIASAKACAAQILPFARRSRL